MDEYKKQKSCFFLFKITVKITSLPPAMLAKVKDQFRKRHFLNRHYRVNSLEQEAWIDPLELEQTCDSKN